MTSSATASAVSAVPKVVQSLQFPRYVSGKSLPSTTSIDKEFVEICRTPSDVIPLHRDVIDNPRVLRRKGSGEYVGWQSIQPLLAHRQNAPRRLRLTMLGPILHRSHGGRPRVVSTKPASAILVMYFNSFGMNNHNQTRRSCKILRRHVDRRHRDYHVRRNRHFSSAASEQSPVSWLLAAIGDALDEEEPPAAHFSARHKRFIPTGIGQRTSAVRACAGG